MSEKQSNHKTLLRGAAVLSTGVSEGVFNDLDPSAIVMSQIVADPITQKESHCGGWEGLYRQSSAGFICLASWLSPQGLGRGFLHGRVGPKDIQPPPKQSDQGSFL